MFVSLFSLTVSFSVGFSPESPGYSSPSNPEQISLITNFVFLGGHGYHNYGPLLLQTTAGEFVHAVGSICHSFALQSSLNARLPRACVSWPEGALHTPWSDTHTHTPPSTHRRPEGPYVAYTKSQDPPRSVWLAQHWNWAMQADSFLWANWTKWSSQSV